MSVLPTMEWARFDHALPLIRERLAVNDGGKFILDNWNCKYLDVRIDMRTGNLFIKPGNVERPFPEYSTINPDVGGSR